jgi:hypothetical protein
MTKMNAAGVAVALGLAMALPAPFEAAAKSGGGAGIGARSFHSGRPAISHRAFSHRPFSHRPFAQRHRAFRQFPWWGGGFVDAPYFTPASVGDAPNVVFVSPPAPPRALTCQRSRDTVNVQSEDGGTREIRITRC